MTTYTTTQLATRALRDLGVVGAEETPTAADLAWAIETVQSEVQMLARKGIPVWNGSEVSVPQEYLTTLSRRVGAPMATSFGLMTIPEAEQVMLLCEQNLRILGMTGPTGTTQEAEYF